LLMKCALIIIYKMLNKVRQSIMQSAIRASALNATATRSYHSDLGLDPNALAVVEG